MNLADVAYERDIAVINRERQIDLIFTCSCCSRGRIFRCAPSVWWANRKRKKREKRESGGNSGDT
jgi:hypothetical protein